MHPDWTYVIIFLGFIQTAFIMNSTRLLLWPQNHSCARPSNMSNYAYLVNDSRRQPIDVDAIQTDLFDATPEDAFTAARASTMGVHYDDISSCLQYSVEYNSKTGNSTVNMEGLETCRFGLRFEELDHKLSVIGHFRLACSRQWLKILLPQSVALGLLLGIFLTRSTFYLNNYSTGDLLPDQSSRVLENRNSLIAWLFLIMIASLTVQISYGKFDDFDEQGKGSTSTLDSHYTHFISLLLIISFCTSSCLTRVMTLKKRSKDSAIFLQVSEQQLNFLLIIVVHLTSQALFLPVALQMFSSWFELLRWLAFSSHLFVALTILNELTIQLAHWFTSGDSISDDPLDESFFNQVVGRADGNRKYVGINSEDQRNCSSVKVCEFCLMNRPVMTSMVMVGDSVEESSWEKSFDQVEPGYLSAHLSSYAPTTAPLDYVLVPLPATTTNQVSSKRNQIGTRSRTAQYAHAPILANLLRGHLRVEFCALTFCLTFNYFLLGQIPDHKLLHSESIASRYERKLIHSQSQHPIEPDALRLMGTTTNSSSESLQLKEVGVHGNFNQSEVYSLGAIEADHYLHHSNEGKGADSYRNGSLLRQRPTNLSTFDYRSLNYAAKSIETLQRSHNPLEIMKISASLNSWPLDLAVLLLHVDSITTFGSNYFKPSRLFRLINFGALLLGVEWLFLALFRSRNHLLEVNWLLTGALLLARFGAALAVYNFFHTILKLSRKLYTDQLIDFSDCLACALIALLAACFAPILEKQGLVIIPMLLMVNNLIVYLIATHLGNKFKRNLCPLIFNNESLNQ